MGITQLLLKLAIRYEVWYARMHLLNGIIKCTLLKHWSSSEKSLIDIIELCFLEHSSKEKKSVKNQGIFNLFLIFCMQSPSVFWLE